MKTLNTFHKFAWLAFASVVLAACSGGSGQGVESNIDVVEEGETGGVQYNGPVGATEDVLAFKREVWDNLATTERCGSCHIPGVQEPSFVRTDDINLAYQEASTIVDLSAPSLSRMVTKVGEGHSCWETQASVCADIITNYIEAWATAAGAEANVIVLTPPVERVPGESKSFPEDASNFATTVYPLLNEYCASCHSEDAAQAQQPFFASEDVEVAYAAARSKINLDTPASSRFVIRLGSEFHNCWGNCTSNANEMEQAIADFSGNIIPTEVDDELYISRSLSLPDGIVASAGGRIESNVIALYEFKTGSGSQAFDTSGVDPAMHLNITGNVEWIGSWGIRINDGKAQASTSASGKLHQMIGVTGEYSIEAWVVPDNVAQDGPARIVTYSGGADNIDRNFTLGQTLYNYDFLTRGSENPDQLSTPDADEILQATLQHVVVNYHPLDGRSIYVNGELVASDPTQPGNLNDWDDTYAFAVGNEVNNGELWQGTLRLVAMHNRVLTPEEIQTNFDAGVGEKFFLLFGVSHLIDMPQAYVVFQVQQYDNYSYLFDSPFFISLEDGAVPAGDILIEGIRIGVNGQEATIGQSFANTSITINSANYNEAEGVPMSDLGAIIALDKGADSDEFFLTFDQIGTNIYDRTEADVPPPGERGDLEEQSVVGLRNFGEINATMSTLTTVPVTNTSVATVFNTVKQQLPTTEAVDTFLAAHQAGIMQLSVAYCTALVNDTTRRAQYFDGFNFGASWNVAFNAAGRDAVISPLMSAMLASEIDYDGAPEVLDDQADPVDLTDELNNMIDNMSAAGVETTVIATCASAIGSAVMLLQ